MKRIGLPDGPKSLLSDTTEAVRHQVDAVAKIAAEGGLQGALNKRARLNRNLTDLDKDRERIESDLRILDSLGAVLEDRPGKIIADAGSFRSQAISKSIKRGKMTWIENVEFPDLADKIKLAQKFKISTDVPDVESLFEFGSELQKEGLLRMPFPSMYVEYVERFAAGSIKFSLFVEDWDVFAFLMHWNKWLCFHVDDHIEDVVGAGGYYNFIVFLVLLASRSTTVSPSDGSGKPMKVAEGAKPKFSHHIVRIQAFDGERSSHGGHHAPPRLHWRRGHIRRQRCGPGRQQIRKTWIAPMLVGSADRGVVTHDYEVRK